MGKVKIGIFCYFIADILTKVLYLLSGPPPNVFFVSKPLNFISCHGNQKAKFLKKKINSSEAIWGIKLKLCRNVHSMSLYKSVGIFCHCISTLVAMAT